MEPGVSYDDAGGQGPAPEQSGVGGRSHDRRQGGVLGPPRDLPAGLEEAGGRSHHRGQRLPGPHVLPSVAGSASGPVAIGRIW